MKSELPQFIYDYLRDQHIRLHSLLFIQLSPDGQVLSWEGDYVKFGFPSIARHEKIATYLSFLEDCFPIPSSPFILPKMHLSNGNVADVHLFQHELNLWLIMQDQTSLVAGLQQILQKQNQEVYEEKALFGRERSFSSRFFTMLEMAAFDYQSDNTCKIIDSSPQWFSDLFPNYSFETRTIVLSEYFPFLESFLPEAFIFWAEQSSERRLSSQVWTEINPWGIEYFLRAHAFKQGSHSYLFIERMDKLITERQELIQRAREKSLEYERLQKSENALAKLLSFKDHILSIIAKDLQSPLSTMASLMDRVNSDQELRAFFNNKHLTMLEDTDKELDWLVNVRDKLYYWSNLELGSIRAKKRVVKLETIVDEVLVLLSDTIDAKKIKVAISIPEHFFISADPVLMSVVIQNIVHNAVKYTSENKSIELQAFRENNTHKICIKDKGLGIDESLKRHIFSGVFDKRTKGTNGEEGIGVGLLIVKKIIELHAFSIELSDAGQEGTKFVITIPNSDF